MNDDSRNIITAAALISLFFVFPDYQPLESDTGNTLVLLLLAAAGILLSRIFVLSSGSSDRTGIEPSVMVFIASLNCVPLVYPVVAFMGFTGSIINSIRSERSLRKSLSAAIFQGVSFAVLMRLGGFLYSGFTLNLRGNGAVGTYAPLVLSAMILTILRTFSVHFTVERAGSLKDNLKRNMFANSFILLLAVPGTLAAVEHPNTIRMLVTVTLSLFTMIAVHGLSISLNRSAHERTGELETVERLKDLSKNLFTVKTEMEALGILSRSLSAAWQCRSSVRWKNLEYCEGESWDIERGVSMSHPDGLSVSVDSFNSTVNEYLESFLERTVPVLTGLEAEKRMEEASWKSVETMISFLEGNRSDFAGLSRRVAATAEQLCTALGKSSWFRDCVRLAGLLHMIQLPEGDTTDFADQTLALPDITLRALGGMNEYWCGTGPQGKQGEDIPESARILSVSSGWERAVRSGREAAVRDLNMKAGTLFDPRLVEQLLELKS